jgi:hypothetical protein
MNNDILIFLGVKAPRSATSPTPRSCWKAILP